MSRLEWADPWCARLLARPTDGSSCEEELRIKWQPVFLEDMDDLTRLDRSLATDLNACAKVMEQRLGFPAGGLERVVADYGGLEGAKFSLRRPIQAHMLGRMWEQNLLTFTVEAIVLLPWYSELFNREELSEARHRLETMGLDVIRL
jgi:hypothetical protein